MLSARLGDLSHGQREERRAQISSFRQVSDQIAKAKRLVTDRDRGKRRFDDMCADDQQLIEDFETGRLQKRSRSTLAPRGSAFRSQLPSASAAAEHAAASSSEDDEEGESTDLSSASAAAEHAAASSSATIKKK